MKEGFTFNVNILIYHKIWQIMSCSSISTFVRPNLDSLNDFSSISLGVNKSRDFNHKISLNDHLKILSLHFNEVSSTKINIIMSSPR